MAVPAQAPDRRWRNQSVVRELDRTRARWIWTLLAGVAIAAAPLAVYLVQMMRYVETRYAIEDLRSRQERLLDTERRLQIERAELESLPEVERKAVRDLGLVRPGPGNAVVAREASAPATAVR